MTQEANFGEVLQQLQEEIYKCSQGQRNKIMYHVPGRGLLLLTKAGVVSLGKGETIIC